MKIEQIVDHCENCGQTYPDVSDSYTTCCNELICEGAGTNRWNIGPSYDKAPTGRIDACCSAVAEAKIVNTGLKVLGR